MREKIFGSVIVLPKRKKNPTDEKNDVKNYIDNKIVVFVSQVLNRFVMPKTKKRGVALKKSDSEDSDDSPKTTRGRPVKKPRKNSPSRRGRKSKNNKETSDDNVNRSCKQKKIY